MTRLQLLNLLDWFCFWSLVGMLAFVIYRCWP